MQKLDRIAEEIRGIFDTQMVARDRALGQARALTRFCALTIRAVHRDDSAGMEENLAEARKLAASLGTDLQQHPDLYHAGYTQDALKEFVEANVTCALILDQELPTPQDLGVPHATYLNGLAEVIGELRRRCLDILRHGYSDEAERLLSQMDDIYLILVTMDYPDALTNGLRRQTDVARGIIERTRGDVTFSLRGEQLEHSLTALNERLTGEESGPALPGFARQETDD